MCTWLTCVGRSAKIKVCLESQTRMTLLTSLSVMGSSRHAQLVRRTEEEASAVAQMTSLQKGRREGGCQD